MKIINLISSSIFQQLTFTRNKKQIDQKEKKLCLTEEIFPMQVPSHQLRMPLPTTPQGTPVNQTLEYDLPFDNKVVTSVGLKEETGLQQTHR